MLPPAAEQRRIAALKAEGFPSMCFKCGCNLTSAEMYSVDALCVECQNGMPIISVFEEMSSP